MVRRRFLSLLVLGTFLFPVAVTTANSVLAPAFLVASSITPLGANGPGDPGLM